MDRETRVICADDCEPGDVMAYKDGSTATITSVMQFDGDVVFHTSAGEMTFADTDPIRILV